MKKYVSFLLAICLIFMVTSCTPKEQSSQATTASDPAPSLIQTNSASLDDGKTDYYPEAVTFFARILESQGRSLFVIGNFWNSTYHGYAYLPEDISSDDFKKGDYVAITFPGLVMETYPPMIHITEIRHLDKMELSNLPKEEEHCMRLEYMGKDDTKIIGICMDKAYAIPLSEFENIPDMNFGDYFTVIYEETRPGIEPTQILFIKDLYLSDENGAPIE